VSPTSLGGLARFGLSYRDVEELLAERGIRVDHVTVYRWVQSLPAELIDSAGRGPHATGDRWLLDDTHVKVSTDRAPVYPRVIDELAPAARHVLEQYANNRVEADTADSWLGCGRFADGKLSAHSVPLRPAMHSCSTCAAGTTTSPSSCPVRLLGRHRLGVPARGASPVVTTARDEVVIGNAHH
jgi:hypothetical protein